jgi:hypothetical protein
MITGDAEMKADIVFANEMETESLLAAARITMSG